MPGRRTSSKDGAPAGRGVLAASAVAVLAVACCAGGPAIAAALGSLALGSVLGWTVGVALLAVSCAAVALRARRRRAPANRLREPRA